MPTLEEALSHATDKATEELSHKTMAEVQYATSIVWAGRALACYARFAQSGDLQDALDAEEFAHEALEHGALSEVPGHADALAAYVESAKHRALATWGHR